MKKCTECPKSLDADSLYAMCPICRRKHREWGRKAYRRHTEKRKQMVKSYRKLNPIRVEACRKRWRDRNLGWVRSYNRMRQAKRLKRMPSWADSRAIEMFYRKCPDGMVVDHIIPLCGKIVSGLHVLSNLQYLTPKENRHKSSTYPMASQS